MSMERRRRGDSRESSGGRGGVTKYVGWGMGRVRPTHFRRSSKETRKGIRSGPTAFPLF